MCGGNERYNLLGGGGIVGRMFLVVLSRTLCSDDPPCVHLLSVFLSFLVFAFSPACIPSNHPLQYTSYYPIYAT